MADAQLIGSAGSTNTGTAVSGAGSSTGLTKFLVVIRAFTNTSFDSIGGTLTDSNSNSYTQIGSTQYGGGGDIALSMYLCESGTGSASHTAQMVFGITPFSATIDLLAITGAAATSLDVHNGTNGTYANGAAISIATGALGFSSEVIVAVAGWDNDTLFSNWTSATMTVLEQSPGGTTSSGVPMDGAVGKLVVSSSGSTTIDLTTPNFSVSSHGGAIFFATFKDASAGGSSPPIGMIWI